MSNEKFATSNDRWASGIGPYVRMHSGRKFPLADPTPADYQVSDIAYHLARINRYTGGSEFSIAQHSVVGARMAERFYPDHALLPARFMIHDVSEHAIGDVSSPLKSMLPDYKILEQKHELVVEQRFDLMFLGVPEVRELDNRMWITERGWVYREAMEAGVDMTEDVARIALEPFDLTYSEGYENFTPWGAEHAQEQYLVEFRRLLPWVTW